MPEVSTRRAFLSKSLSGISLGLIALHEGVARGAAELTRPINSDELQRFSFLHFSDTHIDPRLEGQLYSEQGRSVETLKWLAKCSRKPVVQESYDLTADVPAFAIHTGDVMEYGPAGYAWGDFETAVADIACPICLIPGNHDNTWGEINHLLRHEYGNDSYSFDFGGCHFVCINSSGLLDALPCLDRRTLDWMAEDMSKVPISSPLFLALHHPLSEDAGYASEYDKLRLWKLLDGRRVALIMDGHWHTVHHRLWQGIDRVNGGATFGEHTGYNSVTLDDGMLRVVFEYKDFSEDRPKTVPLLEKPLGEVVPLKCYKLSFPTEVPFGKTLSVDVSGASDRARGRAWIDNDLESGARLSNVPGKLTVELATDGLCSGWHYISARVRDSRRKRTTSGERFKLLPAKDAPYQIHETHVGAGVKTRPLVGDDLICVANTSGRVLGLSRQLELKWQYDAKSQIVHSLTRADGFVLAGDIDGIVHCLRANDGKLQWKTSVHSPFYAAAAIKDDVAYFLDASGFCHAISYSDGQLLWSRKVADMAFESCPHLHGNRLVAGSWDGFIYAVDLRSGDVLWKSWNPKGHKDVKSRYYGAADCSMTSCADTLYACDRGWILGQYSSEGDFEHVLHEEISAISASCDGKTLLAKAGDNRLLRLDHSGQLIWETEVATGRAPTQPVDVGSYVAVLSDTGLLSLLNGETGEKWIEYSVSPRLFCLSGIGTDGVRTLVMSDMDGQVTCMTLDA